VVRLGINVTVHDRRKKGSRKRNKKRVCRQDVKEICKYAVKHFKSRDKYFKELHDAFDKGRVSATMVLQEVMECIRACVRCAERDARADGKTGQQVKKNVGAAWFDEECKMVNDRAWAYRRKSQAAKKAIPPLPLEEVQAMDKHASELRAHFQRMRRRKISHLKQEAHRRLIEAYFSSKPQSFWDVFKGGTKFQLWIGGCQ
jgi:hypothetical protein